MERGDDFRDILEYNVQEQKLACNGTSHGVMPIRLSLVNGIRTAAMSTITHANNGRSTAAIIVIGDEILKGSTVDTNSHFLCRRLHRMGVVVKRISVIGDDVNSISGEVRALAPQVDWLFTTGGIGPTHDDKTFIGLAQAFGDELHLSEEIAGVVEDLVKNRERKKGFAQKLATIPRSSHLLWGTDRATGKRGGYPIVRLHNVVVFPGVPRFCEQAFNNIQDELFPPKDFRPIFSETVYAKNSEFDFSDELTKVARSFEGNVEIGSYPVWGNDYFKTKLVVESEQEVDGRQAVDALKEFLGDNVMFYDAKPWVDTVRKWNSFRERELQRDPEYVKRLDEAMNVIDRILNEYSLDEIALSFNGGKDCTVLLHMLRVKVDERYGPNVPVHGFHIVCDDQFPEMSQFIIDAAKRYKIVVTEVPGPLKEGLRLLKEQRPKITPVLMGSRASDPKGKFMKSAVEWTDADWPRVLRVCPVLAWKYSEVWRTIRGLCVPYCTLYDKGYTSLGGRDSTFPNDKLRVEKNGYVSYLPAYLLEDDEHERHGRSNI